MNAAAASTSEVLRFHFHGDVFGLVLALAVAYEYGLRRLAAAYAPRGEEAVTRRQRIVFYTGLALLTVVRTWPIHDIGEQSLFFFHMIEHMTLSLLVPPLLLLGTPWWLLRLAVRPIMPLLRFLTRPIVALALFNATLAFLHWTQVVEWMVTSEPFHLTAHALLFVTATLMWWPVIGPIPDIPRLPPFQRIGYLFLQSLVPTIPASFLTLASEPVYRVYETFPRLWGWSVTSDQIAAGLLMKLGGGLILWTVIAVTFFRWAAEEERDAVPVPAPR